MSKKSCAIRKDKRFKKLQGKIYNVLEQARAILRSEKRWAQGDWGLDAEGNAVDNKAYGKAYDGVCKVCAEGAIACSSRDYKTYRAAVEYIDRIVKVDTENFRDGILEVNDNDGRVTTVGFFTKALRQLRKEKK